MTTHACDCRETFTSIKARDAHATACPLAGMPRARVRRMTEGGECAACRRQVSALEPVALHRDARKPLTAWVCATCADALTEAFYREIA